MSVDTLRNEVAGYFMGLQQRICSALEHLDGASLFQTDAWQREGGGGGQSRIMTEGAVFEKAGGNFSEVFGQMSPEFAAGLPGEGRGFKRWCDEYFFIAHRGEPRGVGGIFFDYLKEDMPKLFAFVRDCGEAFLGAYEPIVRRRKLESYTTEQRAFQEFRRGRYVEFNLLYDRGTVFGLKTGGRVESILMSLPPVARWTYDYKPAPGSREAELYETYLNPRDWANES